MDFSPPSCSRRSSRRPVRISANSVRSLASKLKQKIRKAASAEKGKFRSFVRACLNNYIKDELSKHNAQMRGGRIPHQSVDESDEDGRPLVEPVSTDASADK